MAHYVLTANRTLDGAVLYLDADRGWTHDLTAGRAGPTKGDLDDDLAWARTQEAHVCDPHLIKVKLTEAGPQPLDTKQAVRAAGPDAMMAALGFLDTAPDAPQVHRAEQPTAGV